MKRYFLFAFFLLSAASAFSQSRYYMRYDSVYFERGGGNSEFILRNGTRDSTGGLLTNVSGGRTAFLKTRISGDSLFLGIDTFYLGRLDTAINIGSGAGVFKQRSGDSLEFKSLAAGYGVDLIEQGDSIIHQADTSELVTPFDLSTVDLNKWSITGNAGTIDGTNFIGTTDNIPLSFRVNNERAGRINPNFLYTAFGYEAGNVLGADRLNVTAIGHRALASNTFGDHITAVGSEALESNTTGDANTAVGYRALEANTTGANNVAIGFGSMRSNVTGANNAALGNNSLGINIDASQTTSVGSSAFELLTSGGYNTAIGYDAGGSATITDSTVFIGGAAGFNNTTGKLNTYIGAGTGLGITTGNYNTILGARVIGLSPTLSKNIILSDGEGDIRLHFDDTGALNVDLQSDVTDSTAFKPWVQDASGNIRRFSYWPGGGGGGGGVTDHGALTGLGDDDHTQYALLAGRSGGQTLIGGTGTTDDLILRTTSGAGTTGADIIGQGGNNGATELFRVLNNGRFGIGTATPSGILHVNGSAAGEVGSYISNGTASGYSVLRLQGTVGGLYGLGTSYTTSGAYVQAGVVMETLGAGGLSLTAGNAAGIMRFYTGGLLTGNERARIDASGNFGIGTTGPDRKFDVLTTSGPQIRATYTDNSVYADIEARSNGYLRYTPTGRYIEAPTGSTSNFARNGALVPWNSITTTATSSTTETDISTRTTEATTLGADGEWLEYEVEGIVNPGSVNDGATITIRAYWAGTEVLEVQSLSASAWAYTIKLKVYRTSSSNAKVFAYVTGGGFITASNNNPTMTDVTTTFTNTNIIKVTGQTTDADQGMDASLQNIKWYPANL